MSVCMAEVGCPKRPEEGIGSHGVLDGCELPDRGTKIWTLFFFFFFDFSVALEFVPELALGYQAGLELTDIRLPLPPKCWG